jgi:hypothetical protein
MPFDDAEEDKLEYSDDDTLFGKLDNHLDWHEWHMRSCTYLV